ncbi:MAG: alpha/beta fold hydrolase [Alphaproteobacteria bacterium]|nr:alpha/beta fold hydrolase [Alphaproteobacteria bacterium]MBV9695276.1 alpha/beta fold hydrolase [Alphaproteobacteria bacterium]
MAPDLSAQLTAIWVRVLQKDDIQPDADFFEDLGGDSLMAVGLFLEIERALGVKLPITAIYDARTVDAQAQLVAGEMEPVFSHLVKLKEGDESKPFFIVHGVGGTVMELAPLGAAMNTPRAVYAIQAQGLDGSSPPLDTIPAMAQRYVAVLREIQLRGPYALGGYSFGGLVALEMARLLDPCEVSHLVMIDAFAHPNTWPTAIKLMVRARRTLRRPPKQSLAVLRAKLRSLAARKSAAERTAERAAYVNNWLGAADPNLPAALRETRIAGDAALLAYKPGPYRGRVDFIRARRPGSIFPPLPRMVWGPLVAQLEIQSTTGDHRSILGPHAEELAGRISAILDGHPAKSRARPKTGRLAAMLQPQAQFR